jgi:hypothetical protein
LQVANRALSAALLAAASLFSVSMALSQDRGIRKEHVEFEPGSTGTTIQGSITGYEIVDYMLGAQAGQTMTVAMMTDHTANYFNLMAPGETDVAFFNGSVNDNSYEGNLPESGDYTIRVYMMRSAARRQERASYTLNVKIAPEDHSEPQPPADALVPGTEFHATGNIPCSRSAGQPLVDCEFGVVREGDGSGYVKVFWPEGGNRVLFFEDGILAAFDRSEADGDAKMTVRKEADLFMVRIGDERFEIPEAVIVGG